MEDLLNAFEANLRKKLSTVTVGDYVSNIPITDETYATVSFKVSGEQKKEKVCHKSRSRRIR